MMICSRRLYKGSNWGISLPLPGTGVTSVYFYTDAEVKIEKEPVICGDTMYFELTAEDLDPLKDGVLRYEAVSGDDVIDTNSPFVIVTPDDYQAKTLEEIEEEAYQSGYTEGSQGTYPEAWEDGYESGSTDGFQTGYSSGRTDGYESGYTTGYDSGYTDGYGDGDAVGHERGYDEGYEYGYTDGYQSGSTDGFNSGYESGATDGFESGYQSGSTDGYQAGYDSGVTDGYESGSTDGFQAGYDSGYTQGYAAGQDSCGHGYESMYFTIEVSSGGTIPTPSELEYSLNGGDWTSASTSEISVDNGDVVRFVGNVYKCDYFFSGIETSFIVYGNVLSLFYGHDFKNHTSFMEGRWEELFGMFEGSSGLEDASNLILPDNVNSSSYREMFYGCSSLVAAPVLPATAMSENCYAAMFSWCTSLLVPPELPATTLAQRCYFEMFLQSSITSAPSLPATNLAQSCYGYMFMGCSGLTSSPELPATGLTSNCYEDMFYNCVNLANGPSVLPATSLATTCYKSMFLGCSSLLNTPVLPATTLADGCYASMFGGCSSITSVVLPATALVNSCYMGMFQSCRNLSLVKCLASSGIGQNDSTNGWLPFVSTSGVFIKDPNATWGTGNNGIPTLWTVVDAS